MRYNNTGPPMTWMELVRSKLINNDMHMRTNREHEPPDDEIETESGIGAGD